MTGSVIWTRVRLADVAEVASGAGFPIAYQGEKEGEFPFYKVSDMNLAENKIFMCSHNNAISDQVRKKLRANFFPCGSIIFPKIGAAISTNKKRILTKNSCVDNNVMSVSPNKRYLLSEFIFYIFINKDLCDFSSDSNPPSIRKTSVEDWEISIPPLEEQRRIVDILNHAASIRRLREEARAKTRDLIPALFVDMFGDPATNPKGWEKSTLGANIKGFEGGHSPKAGEDGHSPFRILKLSAVTSGYFLHQESKPAPYSYKPSDVQHVKQGDILITRSNTSNLVGAVALVRHNTEGLLLPDLIWRIVKLENSKILSDYIWAYCQNRSVRSKISQLATGTSDSMKKLSQGRLRTLPLLLPPLPLQQEFSERVAEIEALSALHDRAVTTAEQMAQALLAQVFDQPT